MKTHKIIALVVASLTSTIGLVFASEDNDVKKDASYDLYVNFNAGTGFYYGSIDDQANPISGGFGLGVILMDGLAIGAFTTLFDTLKVEQVNPVLGNTTVKSTIWTAGLESSYEFRKSNLGIQVGGLVGIQTQEIAITRKGNHKIEETASKASIFYGPKMGLNFHINDGLKMGPSVSYGIADEGPNRIDPRFNVTLNF